MWTDGVLLARGADVSGLLSVARSEGGMVQILIGFALQILHPHAHASIIILRYGELNFVLKPQVCGKHVWLSIARMKEALPHVGLVPPAWQHRYMNTAKP